MRFNTNRIPTRWVLSTCLVLALLVVSGQGAEWMEVCKASIFTERTAEAYNSIPKAVVCMEGATELEDSACSEAGEKPTNPANCAFKDLPESLYQPPVCTDLFETTDETTDLATERCKLQQGDDSLVVTNNAETADSFCAQASYKKAFSSCVELRFPEAFTPSCTALDMSKAECIVAGAAANEDPFSSTTPCASILATYSSDLVTECMQGANTYTYKFFCEYNGIPFGDEDIQTPQCVYTKTGVETDADDALCAAAGQTSGTPTKCQYSNIRAARFQSPSDTICQYIVNADAAVGDSDVAYCAVSNGKTGDDAAINRLSVAVSGLAACQTVSKKVKDCYTVTTIDAPTCTEMKMAGAACPIKGADDKSIPAENALCVKAIAGERTLRAQWLTAAQIELSCTDTPAYVDDATCIYDAENKDWSASSSTLKVCRHEQTVYDWEFCEADKSNLGTTGPTAGPCDTEQYVKYSDDCAQIFQTAAVENKVVYTDTAFGSVCVITGTDDISHIVDDSICAGFNKEVGPGKTVTECSIEFTEPTDLQNECTVVPDLPTTDATCKVETYLIVDAEGRNDLTACQGAVDSYLDDLKATCSANNAYSYVATCEFDGNTETFATQTPDVQCVYTKDSTSTDVAPSFCVGAGAIAPSTCLYSYIPPTRFQTKSDDLCQYVVNVTAEVTDYDVAYCVVSDGATGFNRLAASIATNITECTGQTLTPKECIAVTTTDPPSCYEINMMGATCQTKGANPNTLATDGALCVKAIANERSLRAKWESTAYDPEEGGCTGHNPAYVDDATCVWNADSGAWTLESGISKVCAGAYGNYEWEFCAADKDNLPEQGPTKTNCAIADYVSYNDECGNVFESAAAGGTTIVYNSTAFSPACVLTDTENQKYVVDVAECADKTAVAGKTISECSPAWQGPTNDPVDKCTTMHTAATLANTTDATCKVASYNIVNSDGVNDLTACQSNVDLYLDTLNTACALAGTYGYVTSCSYAAVVAGDLQTLECYYTPHDTSVAKSRADALKCGEPQTQPVGCTYVDIPASSFVSKADAECKFIFPDGGSTPTSAHCGVYTSDTEYVGIATSVALNDACTENARTLAECTTPIVIPNETDKCTVPPTLSCAVTGTSGNNAAAVTGDACPFINQYYTYAQTEFDGCDTTELAWNSASCDGKYDADVGNLSDAKKTCMYGNTVAAIEFCEYNLAPPANEATCTFADLTPEGARQATCAELYPPQENTGTASTTDVPMSCVIKTTAGTWIPKTFSDDAVAPAQCANLTTTTLASCAAGVFVQAATCLNLNTNEAKCLVKDTEVEFAGDDPCTASLEAEAIARATPRAECGTYALKPASGACYFDKDGEAYTPRKNISFTCQLTGAGENPSGVVDIYFCLAPEEFDSAIENAVKKDCSNDDAGLVAGTCNYEATIPHATCSVRLEDGSTPTLTDVQCKQFGAAACAAVSVTFTGTEVACSNEITPTPVDTTRTATCAIQLPSGGLVPLPEEDVYGYEDKCAEAIGTKGGEISITPAKCVPHWGEVECVGDAPIVKCLLGNTEVADAECASIEKMGKIRASVCPKSMSFYEWVAEQPESCACGTTPTTTWKCVDTTAIRELLSPIDPYAIRFDYTDARLKNVLSVSDDRCAPTKPTFNIPCACPASTALFVAGSDLHLTSIDGYWKRTPDCGTSSCNIQTAFPTSESQICAPVVRTVNNRLDQTTCASGYIAGDAHTRRCQPDDAPYWTSATSLYSGFAPDECSAVCQVKDAEDKDLAIMNYAYVCVQDEHDANYGPVTKILSDIMCDGIAKPIVECNRHECVAGAQWITGPWQFPASIASLSGFCRTAAGSITFTRSVQCYRDGNVVADTECVATKPEATYEVTNNDLPPCIGTDPAIWFVSTWSACDATTGHASRSIYCGFPAGELFVYPVADSACSAADKPMGTSQSCCTNGGVFNTQTQKCACATGFSGDYCELDNRVTIQVPDFQYAEKPLKMLITGTSVSYDEVSVDLLTKNGDFVGRLTHGTVTPGTKEWSLPTVAPNARYRVRMFKSDALNVTSNDFAIVPELDCKNGGTPNYSAGRCTCTGTFSGKLCDIDLCDGCDDTCTVSNGAARNCCSSGRRFSMTEGTCVSTCTLQCSNGGFGVSKPNETPACQCACAGGWEDLTCTTCNLDCSANGKRDAACETCTCNRGYSTRVEALQCQCRSLVVRLSFRRTSALPEGALHAMKADIAGLLSIDEELVTIQPNNFNSRTGRQNVDIVIASTECVSSVTLVNPTSWFKPADYATEFSTWCTILQTALASSEPLPSFVGYDATLGAAIEDPGCDSTDVSANCMAKAVVGNGGPAVTDDGTESNSEEDDEDNLKWIVPIGILIPLAVLITGVILYDKYILQPRTTTYGSSRTDGNTAVEMTAH